MLNPQEKCMAVCLASAFFDASNVAVQVPRSVHSLCATQAAVHPASVFASCTSNSTSHSRTYVMPGVALAGGLFAT
jgi:hypothetical protein